jgi:hypothetical protein
MSRKGDPVTLLGSVSAAVAISPSDVERTLRRV